MSVVIPTYNCERYISQTLDAVLAQTHRPLEVVLIDDGSTDKTVEIARAYGDPVRVVQQQNQGVCRTRNRGFELSRGEFVCFLDHDDYWYPWKLSQQLEAFVLCPEAGVVYTHFSNWTAVDGRFPEPAEMGFPPTPELSINAEYSGWIYHHFLVTCWALTSTAMLRREVFAGSGGFDPELPYAEDWDLWLRISRHHPFVKLNGLSTLYRQHADQGNRKVRDIDYRTRLLEETSVRWGLRSADGRGVDPQEFKARLARYHMEFGLHHLVRGQRPTALRSLWHAWQHQPWRLRYLAVFAVACLGWSPRQPDHIDLTG